MARTSATTRRRAGTPEEAPAGGLGGVLRGSMSSVMGTVGLNLPLRAVERLTGAVERAADMLERLDEGGATTRAIDLLKRGDRVMRSAEKATRHLDRLDPDFVDKVNEALDVVVEMRRDTQAIRRRLDAIEAELRAVQKAVNDRLDRVPLLRGSRKKRRGAQPAALEGAAEA